MKEITIRKMLFIWFSIEIAIGVIDLSIFKGDINSNILYLISSILIILILLKSGNVNKNLIVERIDDFKGKFKFREIILVVITQILLSIALSSILLAIVYNFDSQKAVELANESPIQIDNYFDLIIGGIAISLIGPILEEIIFRRIIFTRLSKRGGILLGAIISSIVFGSLHIDLAMSGAMMFGFTCCIIYRKYNNILISMSIHIINNSILYIVIIISFIISCKEGSVNNYISANDIRNDFIIGVVLLIISGTLFVRFIYKNRMYLKREDEIALNL